MGGFGGASERVLEGGGAARALVKGLLRRHLAPDCVKPRLRAPLVPDCMSQGALSSLTVCMSYGALGALTACKSYGALGALTGCYQG